MRDRDDHDETVSEEPAEGGGEIDEPLVLVPEGPYELVYEFYETKLNFGKPAYSSGFTITKWTVTFGLPKFSLVS